MLVIHNLDKKAFVQKAKEEESVLLIDPASFVNASLLKSTIHYSIMPIKKEVKELIGRTDKLPKHKISEYMNDCLLEVLSVPRKNNVDKIFQKALSALEEGKNVHSTLSGSVLFIEWLFKHNLKIDKIECDIGLDEMEEAYGNIINKYFYPIALERLLKMLCMFYGQKIPFNINKLISKVQVKLIEIENKEVSISELNQNHLQRIFDFVEELRIKENLPSINIFNKINEEIENLLNLITESEFEVEQNGFKSFSLKNKKENNFIDMYLEVLS